MDLTEIPDSGTFARHPWEVVRAQFFAAVLRPLLSGTAERLLDAGSGDGWFAAGLAAEHPELQVTCFDPGYESGMVADSLIHAERVEYVATQPSGPFGVVTLLDVLEHVPDDRALLAQLRGALRPGGHLLISVPAWPVLFSRHDVALKHERRYVPGRLQQLLGGAGLNVRRSGGLFHSLLPARAVSIAIDRRRRGRPEANGTVAHQLQWRGGQASRRLVQSALRADARVSQLAAAAGLQIPGLSWWALCQSPL